jgi:hypothetical protein
MNFHKVHNGLVLTWKEIEDTIKYEVHKLNQSEIWPEAFMFFKLVNTVLIFSFLLPFLFLTFLLLLFVGVEVIFSLDHTHWHARTHTHTHTNGRTPLDEWSSRRRDVYLRKHSTHRRQTSMYLAGFEIEISASKRPPTYALDRAAT